MEDNLHNGGITNSLMKAWLSSFLRPRQDELFRDVFRQVRNLNLPFSEVQRAMCQLTRKTSVPIRKLSCSQRDPLTRKKKRRRRIIINSDSDEDGNDFETNIHISDAHDHMKESNALPQSSLVGVPISNPNIVEVAEIIDLVDSDEEIQEPPPKNIHLCRKRRFAKFFGSDSEDETDTIKLSEKSVSCVLIKDCDSDCSDELCVNERVKRKNKKLKLKNSDITLCAVEVKEEVFASDVQNENTISCQKNENKLTKSGVSEHISTVIQEKSYPSPTEVLKNVIIIVDSPENSPVIIDEEKYISDECLQKNELEDRLRREHNQDVQGVSQAENIQRNSPGTEPENSSSTPRGLIEQVSTSESLADSTLQKNDNSDTTSISEKQITSGGENQQEATVTSSGLPLSPQETFPIGGPRTGQIWVKDNRSLGISENWNASNLNQTKDQIAISALSSTSDLSGFDQECIKCGEDAVNLISEFASKWNKKEDELKGLNQDNDVVYNFRKELLTAEKQTLVRHIRENVVGIFKKLVDKIQSVEKTEELIRLLILKKETSKGLIPLFNAIWKKFIYLHREEARPSETGGSVSHDSSSQTFVSDVANACADTRVSLIDSNNLLTIEPQRSKRESVGTVSHSKQWYQIAELNTPHTQSGQSRPFTTMSDHLPSVLSPAVDFSLSMSDPSVSQQRTSSSSQKMIQNSQMQMHNSQSIDLGRNEREQQSGRIEEQLLHQQNTSNIIDESVVQQEPNQNQGSNQQSHFPEPHQLQTVQTQNVLSNQGPQQQQLVERNQLHQQQLGQSYFISHMRQTQAQVQIPVRCQAQQQESYDSASQHQVLRSMLQDQTQPHNQQPTLQSVQMLEQEMKQLMDRCKLLQSQYQHNPQLEGEQRKILQKLKTLGWQRQQQLAQLLLQQQVQGAQLPQQQQQVQRVQLPQQQQQVQRVQLPQQQQQVQRVQSPQQQQHVQRVQLPQQQQQMQVAQLPQRQQQLQQTQLPQQQQQVQGVQLPQQQQQVQGAQLPQQQQQVQRVQLPQQQQQVQRVQLPQQQQHVQRVQLPQQQQHVQRVQLPQQQQHVQRVRLPQQQQQMQVAQLPQRQQQLQQTQLPQQQQQVQGVQLPQQQQQVQGVQLPQQQQQVQGVQLPQQQQQVQRVQLPQQQQQVQRVQSPQQQQHVQRVQLPQHQQHVQRVQLPQHQQHVQRVQLPQHQQQVQRVQMPQHQQHVQRVQMPQHQQHVQRVQLPQHQQHVQRVQLPQHQQHVQRVQSPQQQQQVQRVQLPQQQQQVQVAQLPQRQQQLQQTQLSQQWQQQLQQTQLSQQWHQQLQQTQLPQQQQQVQGVQLPQQQQQVQRVQLPQQQQQVQRVQLPQQQLQQTQLSQQQQQQQDLQRARFSQQQQQAQLPQQQQAQLPQQQLPQLQLKQQQPQLQMQLKQSLHLQHLKRPRLPAGAEAEKQQQPPQSQPQQQYPRSLQEPQHPYARLHQQQLDQQHLQQSPQITQQQQKVQPLEQKRQDVYLLQQPHQQHQQLLIVENKRRITSDCGESRCVPDHEKQKQSVSSLPSVSPQTVTVVPPTSAVQKCSMTPVSNALAQNLQSSYSVISESSSRSKLNLGILLESSSCSRTHKSSASSAISDLSLSNLLKNSGTSSSSGSHQSCPSSAMVKNQLRLPPPNPSHSFSTDSSQTLPTILELSMPSSKTSTVMSEIGVSSLSNSVRVISNEILSEVSESDQNEIREVMRVKEVNKQVLQECKNVEKVMEGTDINLEIANVRPSVLRIHENGGDIETRTECSRQMPGSVKLVFDNDLRQGGKPEGLNDGRTEDLIEMQLVDTGTKNVNSTMGDTCSVIKPMDILNEIDLTVKENKSRCSGQNDLVEIGVNAISENKPFTQKENNGKDSQSSETEFQIGNKITIIDHNESSSSIIEGLGSRSEEKLPPEVHGTEHEEETDIKPQGIKVRSISLDSGYKTPSPFLQDTALQNKKLAATRHPVPVVCNSERQPICAVCQEEAHVVCSQCRAICYCNEVCQQKHWYAGHDEECVDDQ